MDKKQQNRIATRRMARELTVEEMKTLKGGGVTPPIHDEMAPDHVYP
ncbi:hypothetical protein [Kordiimonas aestuarii]|nr:hypothetical protein [Kordiimonas aestuarii]